MPDGKKERIRTLTCERSDDDIAEASDLEEITIISAAPGSTNRITGLRVAGFPSVAGPTRESGALIFRHSVEEELFALWSELSSPPDEQLQPSTLWSTRKGLIDSGKSVRGFLEWRCV